jgi:thiol-disulfide isomerase/thioredoxin
MRLLRSRTTAAASAALALAVLTAGCGAKETAEGTGAKTSEVDAGGAAAEVPTQLKFTATTVDGKSFEGTSLAGKDAVLWFWAPWCTVCRGEAPTVAKAAEKWGDKVTFVGMPGLGHTSDMKQFVADTGLGGMRHAIDADGSLWGRFGVAAQPAVAFVNDDAKIQVSPGAVSADQFDAEVERLIQQ